MNDIRQIIERIPGLPRVNRIDLLNEGVVNQVWRLVCQSEALILRCDKLVAAKLGLDRFAEVEIHRSAAAVGIAPELIWADPRAGLLLTQYVPGSVLGDADIQDPDISSRFVRLVNQVRSIQTELPPVSLEAYAWRYAKAVATDEAAKLAEEVAQLAAEWCEDDARFLMCHNDLVSGNIIRTDNDDLMLIDWEYAGFGEPAFDMAVLFHHHQLGAKQRQAMLRGVAGKVDEIRLSGCSGLYDRLLVLWLMVVSSGPDAPGAPDAPDALTEALRVARARLSP